MSTLFHNIAKLYTPHGFTAARGAAMRAITTIEDAAIRVTNGTIDYAGPEQDAPNADEHVDCHGCVAMPGFVDSHTHLVFAGDRSREFTLRAEGRSYQEVAGMNGGILSTVDAVRSASESEIIATAKLLAHSALSFGTTTIEIKSGYGLSTAEELKLLRAAKALSEVIPLTTSITYLGAHAVPREMNREQYVELIVNEQLPAVADAKIAESCDVFMDEGYFSAEDTRRICLRAKELGFQIKLHADELANTAAAELAVQLGALSADHLLQVSPAGIAALAASDHTVATLLPMTALSIREPYAPARELIRAGCAVAIATDCNPGSAMSENMQLAITLAVVGMQMSPEEALTAATLNGAAALGRATSIGSLEAGKQADILLFDMPSLEFLPYHIGTSHLKRVIIRGQIVYAAS